MEFPEVQKLSFVRVKDVKLRLCPAREGAPTRTTYPTNIDINTSSVECEVG